MAQVTYKVIANSEVPKGIGADWLDEWGWSVVRCIDGAVVEWIGCDGGEPEDQLLVRDWKWVTQALQAAYELGCADERKRCAALAMDDTSFKVPCEHITEYGRGAVNAATEIARRIRAGHTRTRDGRPLTDAESAGEETP